MAIVMVADIHFISTGLKLAEDGIWYSSESEGVSYPSDGNESCFLVEDGSFWFKHRNNCIVSIVESFPPEDRGAIFDIGGGNGFVSLGLWKAGFKVTLVEPGAVGAASAKKRGIKDVICATISSAKFRPHSLPNVGLFDVIEHLEDDLNFLKTMRNLMKGNGRLYATVPSYNFLWSAEDISAGHFRRYSLEEISRVITAAGFEVEFASYVFRFLPLPIFLFRTLPYKLGLPQGKRNITKVSREHAVGGGIVSHVLHSLLNSEIENLNHKKSMRFGGSCLIVAKNPQ